MCRRVARLLLELPELSLTAENGAIAWSKLREIVRKASPETELFWLRLAGVMSYKEIEVLVRRTPRLAESQQPLQSAEPFRHQVAEARATAPRQLVLPGPWLPESRLASPAPYRAVFSGWADHPREPVESVLRLPPEPSSWSSLIE